MSITFGRNPARERTPIEAKMHKRGTRFTRVPLLCPSCPYSFRKQVRTFSCPYRRIFSTLPPLARSNSRGAIRTRLFPEPPPDNTHSFSITRSSTRKMAS